MRRRCARGTWTQRPTDPGRLRLQSARSVTSRGADRGGIADYNGGKIASDVFWDRDKTGQAFGVGSGTPVGAANGLTTAQMSMAASFGPTWDFGTGGTWVIPPNATHPILRWQVQP